MIIHDNLKAADDFDLSVQEVIHYRRRALNEELEQLDQENSFYREYPYLDELNAEYGIQAVIECEERRRKVMAELDVIKRVTLPKMGITDDDIESARRYPVDKLIDFSRGKAKAFCHEDKNPSMFHGTKFNLAICPVCDKKFDSIAILMQRDGVAFKDAVNQLAGG